MDLARWWNTNGLLGRKGRILLSRGFPRTHRFAEGGLRGRHGSGLDEEQLELGSSGKFWQMIRERRGETTISRAELEKRIAADE